MKESMLGFLNTLPKSDNKTKRFEIGLGLIKTAEEWDKKDVWNFDEEQLKTLVWNFRMKGIETDCINKYVRYCNKKINIPDSFVL